jgi:hypothetical protein
LRSRGPQAILPTNAMVAQIPAAFSIIPSFCLPSAVVTGSTQAVPADSLDSWDLWLIAAASARHVASVLPFARHGVERSSGQDLQALIILADALAAGGKPDEAALLLQRAAASNLQADPQTVRQLRSRLQRFQAIAPRDTQP